MICRWLTSLLIVASLAYSLAEDVNSTVPTWSAEFNPVNIIQVGGSADSCNSTVIEELLTLTRTILELLQNQEPCCTPSPTPDACASNPCQNGGTCTPTNESLEYQCTCSAGYTGATCASELTKILISDDRVIYASMIPTKIDGTPTNLRDLEYRKIITNATHRIKGVEYDPKKFQIYFAFGTRIDRIHWRGSDQEIFLNGSNVIRDLTLDVNGRKIYWVQRHDYGIRMSDMDIDHVQGEGGFLYSTGISNSHSIFFDRFHGNLYWGESLFIARRIYGVQEVVVGYDNFKWPQGLFVDPVDERLYWCRNTFGNNIESIRLNGTDRKVYFNENSTRPDVYWRTVVYDGVIYWSATNTPGIGRIDVTGNDQEYLPPVLQLRVESDDDDHGNATIQLGTSIDFYINFDWNND